MMIKQTNKVPDFHYNLPFSSSLSQNAELKFNFGGEDFKHAPKTGFVALAQAPEGHQVKSSQTGASWSFCLKILFIEM